MNDAAESAVTQAIASGDERAFERAYDLFHERVRVVAWRIVRRGDWLDEIVNEAWMRAFSSRTSYNHEYPFLVWMAGIVQNVYREHSRSSPTTISEVSDDHVSGVRSSDTISPESIVSEAELMRTLNDCFEQLSDEDARIIRLRYFENLTLRSVAKEVGIAESTLREHRLPDALDQLRRCLSAKGVDFLQLFPAQSESSRQ